MKFYLFAAALMISAFAHGATYLVSYPVSYGYDEYGHYKSEVLKSAADSQKLEFEKCAKGQNNSLQIEYFRVTQTEAIGRNQVLPSFPFGMSSGYGMDVFVKFDEKNKDCTDFVDRLHTYFGKNVRVSNGYSPKDLIAKSELLSLKKACVFAKEKCAVDPESNNCSMGVGSDNLLRNSDGKVKGAILRQESPILFQVCFFDQVGGSLPVRPIYLDGLQSALNQ